MRKYPLKNMDIREALTAAEMKISDLARLMGKEPDNLYHLLWYRELSQNEKDEMFKKIKFARRDADQIISVVRIQNLPAQHQKGWIVARQNDGKLWYWGIYDTEDRADMVAKQLGSGIVLEV